jgi:hypothetical protein
VFSLRTSTCVNARVPDTFVDFIFIIGVHFIFIIGVHFIFIFLVQFVVVCLSGAKEYPFLAIRILLSTLTSRLIGIGRAVLELLQ